jgi:hypothetical protein
MSRLLRSGSVWPLELLDEEKRKQDVKEAITFGNHKGAKSHPDVLANLVAKDVKHGYAMALPLSKALTIPSILLATMNIMHQIITNESR